MEKKYYRLDKLDAIGSKINIIYGGRNIGKSWAVQERVVDDAWNGRGGIGYIRRWSEDIKSMYTDKYFCDEDFVKIIKKISKGKADSIKMIRGELFFTKFDEKKFVYNKVKTAGFAFALTAYERYKSLHFPNIKNLIFEEWQTDKLYLENEPDKLRSLISTIEREGNVTLYMVANTISLVCPYMDSWNLYNLERQKQGTIDVYKYDSEYIPQISVEYCAEKDESKAFNVKGKKDSVAFGNWQISKDYPIKELDPSNCLYKFIFEWNNYRFLCRLQKSDNGGFYIHVVRHTSDVKGLRIISNRYYDSPYYTSTFYPLSQSEKAVFDLVKMGRVMFGSPLIGEQWNNCLKNFKI